MHVCKYTKVKWKNEDEKIGMKLIKRKKREQDNYTDTYTQTLKKIDK